MNKRQKLAAIDRAIVAVLATTEWRDPSWFSCHALNVAENGSTSCAGELLPLYEALFATDTDYGEPYLSPGMVQDTAYALGLSNQEFRANMLAMFRGYVEVME